MQSLLISPDKETRKAIIAEKKTITIREGHRDYKPGPAMLCCHIEPWAVMVQIIDVRHCLLAEVTEGECHVDGYNNHEEMLKDLRRYYPLLGYSSPVTVIHWTNPQGKLVKKYLERKARKGRR